MNPELEAAIRDFERGVADVEDMVRHIRMALLQTACVAASLGFVLGLLLGVIGSS